MKKILLVDDNEHDRVLYKRYLGKQIGHERLEIVEACSGAEGLAQFRRERPDCVLLDHNLLDTDGLTLLRDLQRLTPPDTLCVVMITGGGSEELAVRALGAGALDYLVKQRFDQDLLCKTVVHAIEKNEWRQYVGRYHSQLQTVNQQLRDSLEELNEARQQVQLTNTRLLVANQEAEERNQELARTNRDLDTFVYTASHDLKQPINNLRGLFEELRRSATFNDPDEVQVLRLVDESLRDLTTTVTDLSAVVQVARIPGEQVTEPILLSDLTADVLQTLRPQLLDAQADVHTDFATLPEVNSVRGSLRTILLNLLANAVKYRHLDREVQIKVTSGLADGRAVLAVQDNGLGIDLERHGAELFHLFRRFHPDAGEGTGVGLFLVHRLVQALGGRIEVESQLGVGTTFRLFLDQDA